MISLFFPGQTGSGKTYTMGTADNEAQDPNNQGLVPRFVCDLFDNIDQYSKNETLVTTVSIYNFLLFFFSVKTFFSVICFFLCFVYLINR